MPHITTAMQWSRRRGVGDIVVDSLLGKRAITDSVNSVKTTFSSWDNCMKESYCKSVFPLPFSLGQRKDAAC